MQFLLLKERERVGMLCTALTNSCGAYARVGVGCVCVCICAHTQGEMPSPLLNLAAESGFCEFVTVLIDEGKVEVDTLGEFGTTALFDACYFDNRCTPSMCNMLRHDTMQRTYAWCHDTHVLCI